MARRAVGLAVAALALVVVAGGTRWPWTAAPDDVALIRLDWRARGERVEECRPPTPEEIAERSAHMRPREICEGKVMPYALRVVVDGGVVVDDTIHAAGAREDRPLYVAREITVHPGSHDVRIDFDRIVRGGAVVSEVEPVAGEEHDRDGDHKSDADGEDDEDEDGRDHPERNAAEVTPSVRLEGAFRLAPRQVLVVTYDADRRRLVASARPVR